MLPRSCSARIDHLLRHFRHQRHFRHLRHITRAFSRYPRNDQIYIHHIGDTYVANLLTDPRDMPIGYSSSGEFAPDTFRSNPAFLKLLHHTMGNQIQNDFSFIMEAGANANAFMPIYDFRETPKYARTPEVDDIFGYVLVDANGKIVQNTYEANQLYRLCNGTGLVKFTDFMVEEMRKKTAGAPK